MRQLSVAATKKRPAVTASLLPLQRGAVVRRDAVFAAERLRRISITRKPAELQSLRGAVAQYDWYGVIGAANACEGDEPQR